MTGIADLGGNVMGVADLGGTQEANVMGGADLRSGQKVNVMGVADLGGGLEPEVTGEADLGGGWEADQMVCVVDGTSLEHNSGLETFVAQREQELDCAAAQQEQDCHLPGPSTQMTENK
ncbi:hypothetical protein ABVT39_023240 [Epinephelus coioides]